MEERKTRKAYSTEEDKMIMELVTQAKEQGMELAAVYQMLSEDLDRTEGAVAKRYADLKKAEREALGEPVSLKQLSADMETLPEIDFTSKPQKLDGDALRYCIQDVQSTLDMYEALQKAKEEEKKKAPEVSIDKLIDKLEAVITEKIEMRIERDFYKKKYEELQAKYDKVRKFLEE